VSAGQGFSIFFLVSGLRTDFVRFLQPLEADSAGLKVRAQKPDISKYCGCLFMLNCLKVAACIS
jgi:hypothetical protein